MELIIFLGGFILGAGVVYFSRRLPEPDLSQTLASQAIANLERQIMTWEQIMQQAPEGYLQVDEENHLYFCNHQARQLLGMTTPIGTERKLLLQIVRSFELDQLIEQTRNTNKPRQKAWIFHPTVDDPIDPVEKADIPIKAYSLPLGYGHVGIFIEDRQEAVTLAQQRDRWAADVAHDLKTPLTSIRLIAESLESKVDPALKPWLENLIKQTIRLSDLVQDILELGKIDTGIPLAMHLETVDLAKIIHSAWHSLEPLSTSKQIKLEYIGSSEFMLEADESKLYRLLLNLLDNGIKHSPSLQTIVVNLSQDSLENSKTVLIEIIDCGSGFSESALPHVFDRFYQSEQPQLNPQNRRYNQNGSGLGLAIAYQIVKSHKGKISVNNHPETGGAWVKVTLPIKQT
ncbi:signal transduction histidine kinase [Synechococcus sp. PCC 7502]|uniref:sensor histidine kinase n=1 Tax=Synechococcus sp. PCC 7502 TaxID=1173263 RepID=UPI00029FABF1|nr:PAS domain-containing sensor histidine kinase [Synechococcus sp. PCC 7502]AFY75279.1 signal transduction histidine kinase [Synechococcus sp. PCC 7502]